MDFSEPRADKRQFNKKIAVAWIGIVLLICALAFAFYVLHQAQERNASEVAKLRDDVKGLSDKLSLNAEGNKAGDAVEKEELVMVGAVSGFHLDTEFVSSHGNNVTYGKDDRGYDTLYVDVSVQNKGNAVAFISPAQFKLKDSLGGTYALHTDEMQRRAELEGKQALQSQQLAPGEKITGTIGFQVSPSLSDATLQLGDQSLAVNIQ